MVDSSTLEELQEIRGNSSYSSHYPKPAAEMVRLGATECEIANYFGVNRSTLWDWKNRYPRFANAFKRGKDALAKRVEKSLAERAIGYSHEDVDIRMTRDGEIIKTPIIKHYPPDPTSCIFYLKNKRPSEWKDRIENVQELGQDTRQLIESIASQVAKNMAKQRITGVIDIPAEVQKPVSTENVTIKKLEAKVKAVKKADK